MKKAMTLTLLAATSLLATTAMAQDKVTPAARRPWRRLPMPWMSARR
jgi:hypothetical protein